MISSKMALSINQQINREFFSAYLYLAMGNDAMDKGFKGASNWFHLQFNEEQQHALKLSDYLQDQGVKVELKAIEAPKTSWVDITEMFDEALAHEKKVTAWINEIVDLAMIEKDHATQSMLKWFVDEQVEEEASVSDVLWMLKMASKSNGALFMADKTLAKRGKE